MLHGPRDKSFQLIDVERFFDVIERSVPHGFHRRCHRGMGRNHQNLRTVGLALHSLDEFQARHAGHLQIGNDHVEAFSFHVLQGLAGAGGALHLMTGGTQHVGNRFARLAKIVDHQHPAGGAIDIQNCFRCRRSD